ncbi:nitroreductase family protein [Nonlabens xiamenensis]|uniref:nitroreductase family protein n=1 Tax=Nonlabens xiamenensis TaxID=2341043 RepID=UPI000F61219C|nr:nitroreductase family protein [Nonlabens xiamenensis]
MNSINSLEWRYATKKFDSERHLEENQLDLLAKAFNLTATSYGLQPCRLILVTDQDIKDQMVAHSFGQLQVKDASAVLVLCTVHVDDAYVTEYFNMVQQQRGTPEEVLQPFREFLESEFANKAKEDVRQWARNQAYLIMGNLLTVCAMEKIDSCPMEGFEPKKINQLLGLEKLGLESTLLLPVGYRSEEDLMSQMKKVRRQQQEMISYV